MKHDHEFPGESQQQGESLLSRAEFNRILLSAGAFSVLTWKGQSAEAADQLDSSLETTAAIKLAKRELHDV